MVKLKSINIRNALQVIAGSGGFAILVFATRTVQPTSIIAGIILTFFIYAITIAALIGIFRTQTLLNALQHIVIASVVSFPISIIGGFFWAGEPLEILLSAGYFQSVAIVAFWIGVFSGSIVDAKTK